MVPGVCTCCSSANPDAPVVVSQEHTLYERRGAAAWITLNRPEKRNALSGTLVREAYEHLGAAGADDRVRCVVLTGAGRAFCSGMDLHSPPGHGAAGERPVPFDALVRAIQESAKPVIAAVNGPAFAGGLGLVGASDIVVSAKGAVFSFSEVRLGLIPAIISVVCVPKLGVHHAMRLFLTGERFDAEAALRYGLVHRVVPAEELDRAVAGEVAAIALGGPRAVAECKKLVHDRAGGIRLADFARMAKWSERMFQSEEGREGMASFLEKRKPRWTRDGKSPP